MSNTELKKIAFQLLYENLGALNTERFVQALIQEPSDYTLWQQEFFKEEDVKTLSQKAMFFRKK